MISTNKQRAKAPSLRDFSLHLIVEQPGRLTAGALGARWVEDHDPSFVPWSTDGGQGWFDFCRARQKYHARADVQSKREAAKPKLKEVLKRLTRDQLIYPALLAFIHPDTRRLLNKPAGFRGLRDLHDRYDRHGYFIQHTDGNEMCGARRGFLTALLGGPLTMDELSPSGWTGAKTRAWQWLVQEGYVIPVGQRWPTPEGEERVRRQKAPAGQ